MPYPCVESDARIRRISMSRVPCGIGKRVEDIVPQPPTYRLRQQPLEVKNTVKNKRRVPNALHSTVQDTNGGNRQFGIRGPGYPVLTIRTNANGGSRRKWQKVFIQRIITSCSN